MKDRTEINKIRDELFVMQINYPYGGDFYKVLEWLNTAFIYIEDMQRNIMELKSRHKDDEYENL